MSWASDPIFDKKQNRRKTSISAGSHYVKMAPALAGMTPSTTNAPPDRNLSPGRAYYGRRAIHEPRVWIDMPGAIYRQEAHHASPHSVRTTHNICHIHRPVISTACSGGQPLPWLLRLPPGSSASAETPCTVLMCFFMLSLREKGLLHTKHT